MRADAVEDLGRSGIDASQAKTAGIYSVDNARDVFPDFRPSPALVLPYLHPATGEPLTFKRDGEDQPFCRVRYLSDPAPSAFVKRKPLRYGQPAQSGVLPYFPQAKGLDWAEIALDTDLPIAITEGEKKALAGCLAGLPVIGLGGVYNFLTAGRFLPLLEDIAWRGRTVYIVFDSDAADNPNIQAAEARLAAELGLKRGATPRLVRLPPADDGAKQGLDDFLLAEGGDVLADLLERAPEMRRIDTEVLALNEHVAWIEKDGMIYEPRAGIWMAKSNFCEGSSYSSRHIVVPAKKGDGVKEISVSREWLRHALARRYDDVVFRPGQPDDVVTENGARCLNLWTGLEGAPGDVSRFLELTEHLFRDLPTEHQDFAVKLWAYKAQNPGIKTPIAIGLICEETGTGKSLWAQLLIDAFAPYAANIPPAFIMSDFNGWLERNLLVVFDEAEEAHIEKGEARLRGLISSTVTSLNEKFRVMRDVQNYTQFILTSNELSVAAYNQHDRRMFITAPRGKLDNRWGAETAHWSRTGGGKAILHYLQTYDLDGWTPPQEAPMTADKYMAFVESLTPAQRLAEEMRTADHNAIQMWIKQGMMWADAMLMDGNAAKARAAKETKDALGAIQVRPWYTPEELAHMFPSIVSQLYGTRKTIATPAGEISRQLRGAGIKYLRNLDNPRGFMWRGMLRQYLVIADPAEWGRPITQEIFEMKMASFPRYRDLT